MYYSQGVPRILNKEERREKAKQVLALLKVHIGRLDGLSCLDVGCSSGVITNELAKHFRNVAGIDVDQQAISIAKKNFKRKNLVFRLMSAEKMKFKDNSFDLAICNQVYNFVDNPPALMNEIYRVLKPDGICFFAARNKYAIFEPQYNLPFFSWLPGKIRELYLRITSRGDRFFGKNYLSYWGLKELVSRFETIDYTSAVIKNPGYFGFNSLEKYLPIASFLPLDLLMPLVPNYIWILVKAK